MRRTVFVFYGAGSVAAFLETMVGWSIGQTGVLALLWTTMAYEMPHGLYARLVWGGLWAIACPVLGLSRLGWLQASLILSLFPSVAQLLYFFPQSGGGWFGLAHGMATPVVVLALNLFWALVAVLIGTRAAR